MFGFYLKGCIAAAFINLVMNNTRYVTTRSVCRELWIISLSWFYVLLIAFVMATSCLHLIDWDKVCDKISNWLDNIDEDEK